MKTAVLLREENKFKEVEISDSDKPEISDEILNKWQNIANIIAVITEVSAGLIMKITPETMEVVLKSENEDNPYQVGGSDSLGHGLYCETVIGQNKELYIKNALEDEAWKENPDIDLNMISYCGLPIKWPDDEIFGTICILDENNMDLDEKSKKLLEEFRNVIEDDLNLLLNERKLQRQELEKFFEINLDLLIIANMQGEIIKVNNVWKDQLGYSNVDLEGTKFLDLVHPEDFKFTRKAMRKLGDDKNINNLVNRLQDKDGSYHFIEWNSTSYGKQFYALGRDITDKFIQNEKIKQQKNKLNLIIKGTDAGTWEYNIQTGKTFLNEKWAEMIGYKLEEIEPTSIATWEKYSHPEDLKKAKKNLEKHFRGEIEQYDVEIRMKHKDGHWVWINDRGKVISWTEDNKPYKMFGIHLDITERKKLELELEKHANHDNLTGLPNRKLFFEILDRMILENERDNRKFALLFLDLDGFKDINDNYGHEVGDEVLIEVSKRLLKCIRKSDTAARMGGDEFIILLRNINDKKAAENVVKKIHRVLQEVIYIGDNEFSISSSIGVSIYPDHGKDSKLLLRNADLSMYKVKRNGKDNFQFFEPSS